MKPLSARDIENGNYSVNNVADLLMRLQTIEIIVDKILDKESDCIIDDLNKIIDVINMQHNTDDCAVDLNMDDTYVCECKNFLV